MLSNTIKAWADELEFSLMEFKAKKGGQIFQCCCCHKFQLEEGWSLPHKEGNIGVHYGMKVTHGYCPPCLEDARKENRKQMEEKNKLLGDS